MESSGDVDVAGWDIDAEALDELESWGCLAVVLVSGGGGGGDGAVGVRGGPPAGGFFVLVAAFAQSLACLLYTSRCV